MATIYDDVRYEVDPLITEGVLSYQNGKAIYRDILKNVNVNASKGTIPFSDFEDFVYHSPFTGAYDKGVDIPLEDSFLNYTVKDAKYTGWVPDRIMRERMNILDKSGVNPVVRAMTDIGMEKTKQFAANMERAREKFVADTVTNASNYTGLTAAEGSNWNVATNDPIDRIMYWMDTFRSNIGILPNYMVCSHAVFTAIMRNAKTIARMDTTQDKGVLSTERIAAMVGLDKIVVGSMVFKANATASFSEIWNDNVIFAYSEDTGGPRLGFYCQYEGYPMNKSWFKDPDEHHFALHDTFGVAMPDPSYGLGAYLVTAVLT